MTLPKCITEVVLLAEDAVHYWPATDWMSTVDVDEAAALIELIQTSSTLLRVPAAFQLCQFDPSEPDLAQNLRDWARLGDTPITTGGTRLFTGFEDLTADTQNTKNNFWIRFGLDLQRSSGTAPERAIVAPTVSTRYWRELKGKRYVYEKGGSCSDEYDEPYDDDPPDLHTTSDGGLPW